MRGLRRRPEYFFKCGVFRRLPTVRQIVVVLYGFVDFTELKSVELIVYGYVFPCQINSTRMPLGSWHIMCRAGPWPSNSGANSIGVSCCVSFS